MNKDIYRVSEDEFNYYGYRIMRDGRVISPLNKVISAYFFTYPYSHITMRINGKVIKKNKASLIYELFSGEKIMKRKQIIKFKDGDSQNTAFDNLCLINRPEHWEELKKTRVLGKPIFTPEEKEEIRRIYRTEHISMRKLSVQYDVCLTTIQKIIKN